MDHICKEVTYKNINGIVEKGYMKEVNNALFYEHGKSIISLTDDMYTLISNTDSPNKDNTLYCDCGNIAFATDNNHNIFYCYDCNTIIDTRDK